MAIRSFELRKKRLNSLNTKWLLKRSEDPSKITIPMTRRVFPELIAKKLMGTQPMTLPVGIHKINIPITWEWGDDMGINFWDELPAKGRYKTRFRNERVSIDQWSSIRRIEGINDHLWFLGMLYDQVSESRLPVHGETTPKYYKLIDLDNFFDKTYKLRIKEGL